MTSFAREVVAVLRSLRHGHVVTYGEVAAQAGRPTGARGVGQVLRASAGPLALPWWRVVDARGRLAPGLEQEQARLLRAEGVACRNGFVLTLAAEGMQTCDGRDAQGPAAPGP